MNKFLLVGLLVSLQLNLGAVSVENFKHDSQAFCGVVQHNNNLNPTLQKQFVFDCAKLMSLIGDMESSLHDIAVIQKKSRVADIVEQQAVINKHIMSLTVIRKMLLRIKNKYQLSSQLSYIFDSYRNILDAHYYELNPSYESYLLKQCNVSLKNSMYTSIYGTASVVFLLEGMAGIYYGSFINSSEYRGFVNQDYCLPLGAAVTVLAGYLAYCAYQKINDSEYEYELIAVNK